MPESQQWAFPDELQPKPSETQFDLNVALDAMVLLHTEVPDDAFTAGTLGTERGGYGAVIREDGLVLTVGYLITEAQRVWLTTNRGGVVEAYPLAVDFATGLGLLQPLGKLELPHLERGLSADVKVGDSVFVIGHGGRSHALKARLSSRQEFAGPWEYLLDEALFTAPAHPQWGGAALLDANGGLVGIGSLLMQQEVDGESTNINMFIPAELLNPILEGLITTGRSPLPALPWLGMYMQDSRDRLVVASTSTGGPAARAGVQPGDLVVAVGEERVKGMAELFRAVRRLGPAGVSVPLIMTRGGDMRRVSITSGNRADYLKKPSLQ